VGVAVGAIECRGSGTTTFAVVDPQPATKSARIARAAKRLAGALVPHLLMSSIPNRRLYEPTKTSYRGTIFLTFEGEMTSESAKYFVGLSLLPAIGPARMSKLVHLAGSAEAAWAASPELLRAAGVEHKALMPLLERRARINPDQELERVTHSGARVLTWHDREYPALLKEAYNRPALLYVRGTLTAADAQSLAIVGTRRPSIYGRELVTRITPTLAEQGLTIVSGLALGIDTLAHRSALQAGGRTIAVLGSGLDVLYPSENRALAEKIVANGAVVTEYAMGTQPDAFNFPARNRIISGLALGTLVVEAGEKSGALITSHFAVDQNREVFAFPGRISDKQSAGCNRLIRRGEAKLVSGPEDILEELNLSYSPRQLPMEPEGATPAEKIILAVLSTEPVHIDEIGRQTALPAPEVSSTLTMLELRNAIRHVGSMHYVLAR